MKHYLYTTLLISGLSYAAIPTLGPQTNSKSAHFEHEHELSDSFQSISVDGDITLDISNGPQSVVSYSADNTPPNLVIEISEDTLYIAPKSENKNWFSIFNWRSTDDRKNKKIKITLPRLDSLRMHGVSYANIESPMSIKKISLSGASQINMDTLFSKSSLEIKLRTYTKFNAQKIEGAHISLSQSGTSTFNVSSLTADSFISKAHGQCVQHISKLDSNLYEIALTEQTRSDIDNSKNKVVNAKLHGTALFNIGSLKTNQLNATMSGSSSLEIMQGNAGESNISLHNNASHHFESFKAGKLKLINTTGNKIE
ncbi:DUF2807 domain-containing protein [Candidatus Comchoanobacter bicostacola]|uniref:DUF2807 domain-containing protein n=1 Tax=Candidatus Comchoanobacter bicostacola TaxID=2919598 RepID=A0ABY5DKM1_9GAMM|nr:DUF2807 domain-containing protein [Candidatus Comchoanobacter bicostacola]UTC24367.1 DUF2807 domain-containing protein [Candidatus Comchoanobacter bicostacola]